MFGIVFEHVNTYSTFYVSPFSYDWFTSSLANYYSMFLNLYRTDDRHIKKYLSQHEEANIDSIFTSHWEKINV